MLAELNGSRCVGKQMSSVVDEVRRDSLLEMDKRRGDDDLCARAASSPEVGEELVRS